MEAIAAESIANRECLESVGPGVQGMLWALWKLRRTDLADAVSDFWSQHKRAPCVLEIGLLAMGASWGRDSKLEPELLLTVIRCLPVRLMRVALWSIVPIPAKLRLPEPPELPESDALGLSEQECRRYLKLARFIQYLECTGCGGDAESIIEAVEWFPKDVGKWLKVAGGDKAVILWDRLRDRGLSTYEIAVEFGALVAYTSLRLASVVARGLRAVPERAQCTDVVTVELDIVHACCARHCIDLAGMSQNIEVYVGQVRDVVPRICEEWGQKSIGYLFMDQKGTAFHEDLHQLEQMGSMGLRSRVVADNCLKPGAPFFVWHVTRGGAYNSTIWTMAEFSSEEIEDWMVVCDCISAPEKVMSHVPEKTKQQLERLAWETDHMRGGAESGALHVDDWIAFAQYVKKFFERLGVCATPWEGLPEPPEGYPWDMPLDNQALQRRLELALEEEEGDDDR